MRSSRHKGRLRRSVPAIAGAFLLLAVLPASAQGASGSYTYLTASGQPFQVAEPPSDTCLPFVSGAVRFSNDTTDTAFLYADGACGGGWALVGVGATWDQTGVLAGSVRLGSTARSAQGAGR
ncbi:hypothetical protein [Streptomyces sp. NPDC048442]|uniref:hypothetical protein n=1 Tax=Streptomyces sp. NPDC048442 TaxID=3154823 RepID=UPI00343E4F2A